MASSMVLGGSELVRQAFAVANSWRWDDGGALLALRAALVAADQVIDAASAGRDDATTRLWFEARWGMAGALWRATQPGSLGPRRTQLLPLFATVEQALAGRTGPAPRLLPADHPAMIYGHYARLGDPRLVGDGLAYLRRWLALGAGGVGAVGSVTRDVLVFAQALGTSTPGLAAAHGGDRMTAERTLLRALRHGAVAGSPTIILLPRSERQAALATIQHRGLTLRGPGAAQAGGEAAPTETRLAGHVERYQAAYDRSWRSATRRALPDIAALTTVHRRVARGEVCLHPASPHHLAALHALRRAEPDLDERALGLIMERAGRSLVPGSLGFADEQMIGYVLDLRFGRRR